MVNSLVAVAAQMSTLSMAAVFSNYHQSPSGACRPLVPLRTCNVRASLRSPFLHGSCSISSSSSSVKHDPSHAQWSRLIVRSEKPRKRQGRKNASRRAPPPATAPVLTGEGTPERASTPAPPAPAPAPTERGAAKGFGQPAAPAIAPVLGERGGAERASISASSPRVLVLEEREQHQDQVGGKELGSSGSKSTPAAASAAAAASGGGGVSSVGSFRAGQKRAEVRVPALVLALTCQNLLEGFGGQNGEAVLDSAVAGGATMVLLHSDAQADVGGARLFEAAVLAKTLLRGRAQLLISERADIAAASGADGVVLSDQGLPAVAARRMMEGAASSQALTLPLVARTVASVEAAVSATKAEGADLLLLQPPPSSSQLASATASATRELTAQVCAQVSIPVVCHGEAAEAEEDEGRALAAMAVGVGASGLMLALPRLLAAAAASPAAGDVRAYTSHLLAHIGRARDEHVANSSGSSSDDDDQQETSASNGTAAAAPADGRSSSGTTEVAPGEVGSSGSGTRDKERMLREQAAGITESERELLAALLALLHTACPQMAEISLLEDAMARLDDLFLLVIVGEFNSGKSSVINALLGERFLQEGILPTTNEITLLRHGDQARGGGAGGKGESVERHPDGHFVRSLPAPLLQQMNLVDTPGTNVILERQQRLTEEFVPRADLVLFVLSADRPLTESEVSFLRYIREWGKKVVFVLNKVDMLLMPSEVKEVQDFVRRNAQRLLGVEGPLCFPVSARSAISAKLAARQRSPDLPPEQQKDSLVQDPRWKESGFAGLEDFIEGFMEGSTDAGAERLRLKLDTPLGVASALVVACQRQLAAEALVTEGDLQSLEEAMRELENARALVAAESADRQRTVAALVEVAEERAEAFVDGILRLSNVKGISQYLLSSTAGASSSGGLPVATGFEGQVIGSTVSDVRRTLYEHQAWLASYQSTQVGKYMRYAQTRWPELRVLPQDFIAVGSGSGSDSDSDSAAVATTAAAGGVPAPVAVLDEFNSHAAAVLLEEELRQVIVATFGGFGAAGVSASVLTAVLPTTLEDLLALAACTAGGYIGAMNMPKRREEVKSKIRRAAQALTRRLQDSLEAEAQAGVRRMEAAVTAALQPYSSAAVQEQQRVARLQDRLDALSSKLRTLRLSVQNLGS